MWHYSPLPLHVIDTYTCVQVGFDEYGDQERRPEMLGHLVQLVKFYL